MSAQRDSTQRSRLASIYEAPQTCSISWKHLKYQVQVRNSANKEEIGTNKDILKDVSGRVAPGQSLAIMGPSGSGKTTLLDILAGRVSSGIIRGDIYFNGKPRDPTVKHKAKYVAQQDALYGVFTVLETLSYTANLTFGRKTPVTTKQRMIDSVVDELGLHSCLNTRVGDIFIRGLSGGQKRRLSIAIELLSRPSILLLDEPTSGLDSASAFSVMGHIRDLVHIGHSVAVTIHQPSFAVWEMFTHFMLLVEGRTLFFGSRTNAIEYFNNLGLPCPQYSNPSDYFLEVVNTDFEDHADVDDLVSQFLSSEECGKLVSEIDDETEFMQKFSVPTADTTDPVPLMTQYKVLLKRSFLNNIRNPGVYIVRAVMYFMIAAVAGSMYWNSNGGTNLSPSNTSVLLFFVHAFMVFLSLSVLPFFLDQRAVFLRERANGLVDVLPYCIANFVSGLPILFVVSFVSSVIVTSLAGLNNLVMFSLILFVTLTTAEAFVLCVSAVVSHYIVGIALGSGVMGAMLLCSGMTVSLATMPFYWIWLYYIGMNTYAFEAFMLNQFPVDTVIIKSYDMEEGVIETDIITLCVQTMIYQVIFFVLLFVFHTGQK